MSGFTCRLKIATDYTPAEIFALLRENLPFVTGVSDDDPRFPRTLFTTMDALQIDVTATRLPHYTEEDFGFRPTVTVSFELGRNLLGERETEGEGNVARGVDWIVNHLNGDMVYMVNGDSPGLLRRGNQIWLDRKDSYWREEDLQKLTFPYEWKKLS
jgi:hypothetical protein